MKKVIIALVAMYTAVAVAGAQSGRVTNFLPYTIGGKEVLIFKLENNSSNGCNTSGRYAIDSTSPHFKATQAAVIAAFHAQTNVQVAYSESCSAWSNAWDVGYVCTGNC